MNPKELHDIRLQIIIAMLVDDPKLHDELKEILGQ